MQHLIKGGEEHWNKLNTKQRQYYTRKLWSKLTDDDKESLKALYREYSEQFDAQQDLIKKKPFINMANDEDDPSEKMERVPKKTPRNVFIHLKHLEIKQNLQSAPNLIQ